MNASQTTSRELRTLLDRSPSHISEFREKYLRSLLDSCDALDDESSASGYMGGPQAKDMGVHGLVPQLIEHRHRCKFLAEECLKTIQNALLPTPDAHAERIMQSAELWPRITPWTLLRLLVPRGTVNVSSEWQAAIASYGRAITLLQQADRLVGYASREETAELQKEANNMGGQGWDPVRRPDWLLIEIEHNFLIRDIQAGIAKEMIAPAMNGNNVLQLNMGEGKSSVIVPIVSAALADGKKLVRVVVLKALSAQMFQILAQRLGGLANRRIFYLPFSRSFQPDATSVQQIQDTYEECMRLGGILLVQPEHILSFRLMGLERLVGDSQKRLFATELLRSQDWLHANARDILDESDEILNVRYQLIYTMGNQHPLEAHPDRWAVMQEIFTLVAKHAKETHKCSPDTVEVLPQDPKGSFPYVRVLQDKAGQHLLDLLVSDICIGLLSTISFRLFPEDMKQLASTFIGQADIPKAEYDRFEYYCIENGAPISLFLLLNKRAKQRSSSFSVKPA